MDWFERLTGFQEGGYAEARAQLEVVGERLCSRVSGASYDIGGFELASLHSLRERAKEIARPSNQLHASVVTGDVREMHRSAENSGALFQVASQFNLLEMSSPDVTPEDGVTRYRYDRTQGPACAIAAGAATIYRNYFVPVAGASGQTAARQLDGLADLGAALSLGTGMPLQALWTMRNGYALCTERGLCAITEFLESRTKPELDELRGLLRIGVHRDVEATEAADALQISQAFCSALPVAYGEASTSRWEAFASLVLEAAYEATLWAGVLNARDGGSNVVFLTMLGGGAFGNPPIWIHEAVKRALTLLKAFDLDVRVVSYGKPTPEVLETVNGFR